MTLRRKPNEAKNIFHSNWITVLLLVIGVIFLSLGIWREEYAIVMSKAINICLECIELDKQAKKSERFRHIFKSYGRLSPIVISSALSEENISRKDKEYLCTGHELLFLPWRCSSLSHWCFAGYYWKLRV